MLSVVSALYWEIDLHFRVTAGSFHPKPKVDAEVLIMRPRVPAPFADNEEDAVIETVRAAFSSRRKTLRNALSSGLKIVSARAQAALERAAIDPGARAETLEAADFVRLTRASGCEPAMPELPEVESLRRILSRSATGLTIVSAKVLGPRRRRKVSRDFEAAIAGRRIEALARRAKYLIIQAGGRRRPAGASGDERQPDPPAGKRGCAGC